MAEDKTARERTRYEAPQLLRLQVPESARAGCILGQQASVFDCQAGLDASDACSGGSYVGGTNCLTGSSLG